MKELLIKTIDELHELQAHQIEDEDIKQAIKYLWRILKTCLHNTEAIQ